MEHIRPSTDRLIEASRPRPEIDEEDDNRGYVVVGYLVIALCIMGAGLILLTLWLATVSRVETELLVTPEAAIALMEGR